MRVSNRSETCALKYEPPCATVRRASNNSVEDAFFSTNARAPERMALTTEFSSSNIDRMMTLTPGQCRSSSVVASIPFIPGKPMSMRTRSGRDFRHNCTASAPFSASPTTRNSDPRSRIVFTPSRTNLWSSTSTISKGIVSFSARRRLAVFHWFQRGPHQGAALVFAGDRKLQSGLRGVIFHAQEPQAAACTHDIGRIESPPVVSNLQHRSATCGLYRDFDGGASGMLQRILHRFQRDVEERGSDLGVDFQ